MNETMEKKKIANGAEPPTFMDKVRMKLFPARSCPIPEAPKAYKDSVVLQTVFLLTWADRIRIFLSGRVGVMYTVVTQHEMGDGKAASVIFALPFKWLSRKEKKA